MDMEWCVWMQEVNKHELNLILFGGGRKVKRRRKEMKAELEAWSPGSQSCVSFAGAVLESLRALQPALGG